MILQDAQRLVPPLQLMYVSVVMGGWGLNICRVKCVCVCVCILLCEYDVCMNYGLSPYICAPTHFIHMDGIYTVNIICS